MNEWHFHEFLEKSFDRCAQIFEYFLPIFQLHLIVLLELIEFSVKIFTFQKIHNLKIFRKLYKKMFVPPMLVLKTPDFFRERESTLNT